MVYTGPLIFSCFHRRFYCRRKRKRARMACRGHNSGPLYINHLFISIFRIWKNIYNGADDVSWRFPCYCHARRSNGSEFIGFFEIIQKKEKEAQRLRFFLFMPYVLGFFHRDAFLFNNVANSAAVKCEA